MILKNGKGSASGNGDCSEFEAIFSILQNGGADQLPPETGGRKSGFVREDGEVGRGAKRM